MSPARISLTVNGPTHGKPSLSPLLKCMSSIKPSSGKTQARSFLLNAQSCHAPLSRNHHSLHQGTWPAPPHPQLPTRGPWLGRLILLTIFPRHRWWYFFHFTRYFWSRCCWWCCTALCCWALNIRDSLVNSFQWRKRVCKRTVRRR